MTGFQWLRRILCTSPPPSPPSKAPVRSDGLGDLIRLPAEIRIQIWQEVLGRHVCHMIIDPSYALTCYICSSLPDETTHPVYHRVPLGDHGRGTARCYAIQRIRCRRSHRQNEYSSVLPLLCTSRTIQSEANEVVYDRYRFTFGDLGTLQTMLSTTGFYVSRIRTVDMTMGMWKIWPRYRDDTQDSDSPSDEWVELCNLLAVEFRNLQHLRLGLYGAFGTHLHRGGLHPLLKLRGLKSFQLTLWPLVDQHIDHWATLSDSWEEFFRGHICE